jgi:hypothetical protein
MFRQKLNPDPFREQAQPGGKGAVISTKMSVAKIEWMTSIAL